MFLNLNYVVTETGGPDSFDPKNADMTQNLSVMRMLYATPLETDENNLLKSFVLKSFSYDELQSVAKFELKKGVRYSDGSLITINDIALAIARTGYFNPSFPVIKNIKGLQKWAMAKNGIRTMPEGMGIFGDTLTINFDQKMMNPLFRFCLELFSIIPAKCINLDTAEMVCERAPSSGYFTLVSRADNKIEFEKRKDLTETVGEIAFEKITFEFKSISDGCRGPIRENEIIAGSEIDFLSADCLNLSERQIHWMPSARFLVLRFNPHVPLFSKKEMRQYFAQVVRDQLAKNSTLIVENSLFPKLLPGYLRSEEFEKTGDLKSVFKNRKIMIPRIHSTLAVLFDAILEAAKFLEMDIELIPQQQMGDVADSFLKGKFPVIAGGSGFWAQDPIGDVSMWFTKNLHKTMTFAWDDDEVYRRIGKLEVELDPTQIKYQMEGFNRHIHEQSLLAPVLHYRRMFISSPSVAGLNLPQAITSPAPWQLRIVQK
jgi:ABC-type transport system substrate-binding protein